MPLFGRLSSLHGQESTKRPTALLVLFVVLVTAAPAAPAAQAFVLPPTLSPQQHRQVTSPQQLRQQQQQPQRQLERISSSRSTGTTRMASEPSPADSQTSMSKEVAGVSSNSNHNTNTNSNTHSLLAKVGQSTSAVVSGAVFVSLVVLRTTPIVSLVVGSVANALLSKALKRVVRQERPESSSSDNSAPVKSSDPGMPSSHAMSCGFIGTYTVLQLFHLASITGSSTTTSSSSILHPALAVGSSLAILIYVAASLTYRVQVQLHTVPQIVVGSLLGSFNGAWWWSWTIPQWLLWTASPNTGLVQWLQANLLVADGRVLPWSYLWLPLMVGALTVGSVERRIAFLFPPKNDTGVTKYEKED